MFEIEAYKWYAGYIVPGFSASEAGFEYFLPFCTPIHVERFSPQKSGRGVVEIVYTDLMAENIKNPVQAQWKVIHRGERHLVAVVNSSSRGPDVTITVCDIDYLWLDRYCSGVPSLTDERPRKSIQEHLSQLLSMRKNGTMFDLFPVEVKQWGLRGDSYLWSEMRRSFFSTPLPASENEVKEVVSKRFNELTGFSMAGEDDFYLEKYAHGGMSSGDVCREFWNSSGIDTILNKWRSISPTDLSEVNLRLEKMVLHGASISGSLLGMTLVLGRAVLCTDSRGKLYLKWAGAFPEMMNHVHMTSFERLEGKGRPFFCFYEEDDLTLQIAPMEEDFVKPEYYTTHTKWLQYLHTEGEEFSKHFDKDISDDMKVLGETSFGSGRLKSLTIDGRHFRYIFGPHLKDFDDWHEAYADVIEKMLESISQGLEPVELPCYPLISDTEDSNLVYEIGAYWEGAVYFLNQVLGADCLLEGIKSVEKSCNEDSPSFEEQLFMAIWNSHGQLKWLKALLIRMEIQAKIPDFDLTDWQEMTHADKSVQDDDFKWLTGFVTLHQDHAHVFPNPYGEGGNPLHLGGIFYHKKIRPPHPFHS